MTEANHKKTQLIAEEAIEWLLAFEDESPNESQDLRVEFVAWLKQSPTHVKEFLYASNLCNEIKNNDTLSFIEEAVTKQQNNVVAMDDYQFEKSHPTPEDGHPKFIWQRAVAVAFLGIMVWASWLLLTPQETKLKPTYATNIGEQSTVLLPDGTTVKLNTETEIELHYSPEFRTVELIAGEAIFDVAKDPNRPFRVNAGQTVAEALGTSFNVYRQQEQTIITVVEGIVKVTGNHDQDKPNTSSDVTHHALKSGDQVTVKNTGEINDLALVDPENVIAWTSQRLVFEHATLETVVNEMNRYNHNKIAFKNPQLKARKISGVFSTYDPEILLGFLTKVGGITVEQNFNGWLLSLPE